MTPEVIFKGKVIETIRKMSFEHSEELGVFIGKDGKPIKILFADKLLDEIIKMPPVDREMETFPTIEERKTGKWQETDDGWDGVYYVCSECGCPWTLIDGTPSDNGMNFCPNCGTKMVEVVEKPKEDEEGEDDEQTD